MRILYREQLPLPLQFLKQVNMKRILTGLMVVGLLVSLASCGPSSRGGVGCPGNPTSYRGR
jgi:hypothetical protein